MMPLDNLESQKAMMGVGIVGVGKYLPETLITNEELQSSTGMLANDIVAKTGIETRRRAGENEVFSDMALKAAEQALESAGIQAEDIGLIITCSFTGDYVYPASSCRIQERLKAVNAGAFDIMANCTGFQVGLGVASDRMKVDRTIDYVLLIGGALQSRFINYSDANSAIYFGDGVGAAVLGRVPEGYGIISHDVRADGRAFDAVRLRGGGSSHPISADNVNEGLQYYEIVGLEVWKQVVSNLPKSLDRAMRKISKTVENVDFFVFHQANLRLIEFLMGKMRRQMTDTYTNVERYGNTADASQAIALCDAVNAGKLKRGDLVAVSGVGAGFVFGTTIIRWY